MITQRESLELALSFLQVIERREDLIKGSDRKRLEVYLGNEEVFQLDLTVGWCGNMTRWFRDVLCMTCDDVMLARKDFKDYQELLGYDRHCPIQYKHYDAKALYEHHSGSEYMWGVGGYADARWDALHDIIKHLERFLEEAE